MTRRSITGWRLRLVHTGDQTRQQATELPAAPTPPAMAEAVALIAGRAYAGVNLGPSGDVPHADLVRALVNIAAVLLADGFPQDRGQAFLRMLGADAATGQQP